MAFIGWRHAHDQRQLVAIQRDLQQRGLAINERTVGKLYRQFLALLAGMTTQYQQRLEAAVQLHGGLIWAIHALQPAGSDPPRYVRYEVLRTTPLSALQDRNPTADRLRAWRQPFSQCSFPVLATLADGEKAVVAALTASWRDVPQQRGQRPFLNTSAEPAMEVAARLRHHRRAERGGLAAVPESRDNAPPAPTDAAPAPPLAPRSALPH